LAGNTNAARWFPLRALDDWVPPYTKRQIGLWEVETLRQACGHLLQEKRGTLPYDEATKAA